MKIITVLSLTCFLTDFCATMPPFFIDQTSGDGSTLFSLYGPTRANRVGRALCNTYDDYVDLTRLIVHPDYRGRGLGTQLLQRVAAHAQQLGKPLRAVVRPIGNDRSESTASRLTKLLTFYED